MSSLLHFEAMVIVIGMVMEIGESMRIGRMMEGMIDHHSWKPLPGVPE